MQVRLLGSVTVDDQLLTGSAARLVGLLGVLRLQKRQISRARVAGMLFGDVAEEQARRLLTKTLYRLRQTISPELIVATDNTLQLADGWLDVRQLCAGQPVMPHQLLDLYRGDLLEDLDATWVVAPRTELREQFLAMLSAVIPSAKPHDALLLAYRWVAVDSLDEAANRALITQLARHGRVAAALKQYAQFCQLLWEELALEPSGQLRNLVDAIKADRQAAAPVPAKQSPFVARLAEKQRLLDALRRTAAGETGQTLMLLTGEAGMGKSRLLQEVARSAEWLNLNIAWGSADEAQQISPIAQALRSIGTPSVLARLSPLARQTLQQLHAPQRPTDVRTTHNPHQTTASLRMAIEQLLTLATQEQPLAIVLEDIHWARAHVWPLLTTMLSLCSRLPLLICAAARPHELKQSAAARTAMTDWLRLGIVTQIELPPFTALDSAELAHHLNYDQPIVDLHQQSSGNPLVLRELIAHGRPPRLDHLFANRLKALDATARTQLEAATILGCEFSFADWQHLITKPLNPNPLLQQQVLVASEMGYQFQHDLLRSQLYAQLDPAQRRRLHQRAAVRLMQRTPARRAWHFEQAGQFDQARVLYIQAARHAWAMGAIDQARAHLVEIERLAGNQQPPLAARLLRIQLAQVEGVRADSAETLAEIASLAEAAGDLETVHGATEAHLNHLVAVGNIAELEPVGLRAIELAKALGARSAEVLTLNNLAHRLAVHAVQLDRAAYYAQLALERSANDPYLVATSLLTLTHLNFKTQQSAEGRRYLALVKALFDDHQLPTLRERFLTYRAFVAQVDGQLEMARDLHQQRVALCRESGDAERLESALFNCYYLARKLGQNHEAILVAESLLQHAQQHYPDTDPHRFARITVADAYLLLPDVDQARKLLAPLERWLETHNQGRSVQMGLLTKASLHYLAGEFDTAYAITQRFVAFEHTKGSFAYMPLLMHAETSVKLGKLAEARDCLEQARELIDLSKVNYDTLYFHWVAYLSLGDWLSLARARDMMLQIIRPIRSPQFQRDVLLNRTLNQEVEAAWAACPHPQQQTHQIHGRELVWTTDDGLLDAEIARQGKVALRRHRLWRLYAEAIMVELTPSASDYARALGVSTRTIERDLAHWQPSR